MVLLITEFQFHTVRLRLHRLQQRQRHAAISIPHSPIEARAERRAVPVKHVFQFHTVRLRHLVNFIDAPRVVLFQFHTVRLRPVAAAAYLIIDNYFNSTQSD